MRFAKTLATLLLIVGMTANLFAASSCAELCAAMQHGNHGDGHVAKPAVAEHHAGHAMSMAEHAVPAQAPASVERATCSAHVHAAARRDSAALPRSVAVAALELSVTAAVVGPVVPVEALASPPISPHLPAVVALRI